METMMGKRKRPWKFFLEDYREEYDFADFKQGGDDDDDDDESPYEDYPGYGEQESREWREQRTTILAWLKVENKGIDSEFPVSLRTDIRAHVIDNSKMPRFEISQTDIMDKAFISS